MRFWCKIGATLCATIFDVIYAMSITARDNYSLTAIIISFFVFS